MSHIIRAAQFAKKAHEGQFRKFTGDPYILHPARVANWVTLLDDIGVEFHLQVAFKEAMVCAAWLHDVVEDCGVSLITIADEFGFYVCELVKDLTNEYKKEKYPQFNRAKRKELELERYARICKAAQIIKLCDRIDNLMDCPDGTDFLKVYIPESKELAGVLKGTHEQLEIKIWQVIREKELTIGLRPI